MFMRSAHEAVDPRAHAHVLVPSSSQSSRALARNTVCDVGMPPTDVARSGANARAMAGRLCVIAAVNQRDIYCPPPARVSRVRLLIKAHPLPLTELVEARTQHRGGVEEQVAAARGPIDQDESKSLVAEAGNGSRRHGAHPF